jgi:CheY-like chemotaxis protein
MNELDPREPPPQERAQGQLADAPATSLATPLTYGILVVDDEWTVRAVLSVVLREKGFALWLAADGQEALDLYRRHHKTIGVVLLDVRMPGRDGVQTLAALQEVNPRVRCCFMSGDLGSYTEQELCDLGAAAVLQKPFRVTEVAQMLWELAGEADLSLSGA